MRVVITQPNYLPWRGWFAQAADADLLILYDTVQYTKRDWRNRNRIQTAAGTPTWLTIPVQVADRYHQTIRETKIADSSWCCRHLRLIDAAYSGSPSYLEFADQLKSCLLGVETAGLLLDVTKPTTAWILGLLEVKTPVILASSLPHEGNPSERLAQLVEATRGTTYLTGPSALSYLDTSQFTRRGIRIEVFEYAQLEPDPGGQLPGGEYSVIDALARLGPERVKELITPTQSWTKAI
jgi:hypothetical protein